MSFGFDLKQAYTNSISPKIVRMELVDGRLTGRVSLVPSIDQKSVKSVWVCGDNCLDRIKVGVPSLFCKFFYQTTNG